MNRLLIWVLFPYAKISNLDLRVDRADNRRGHQPSK